MTGAAGTHDADSRAGGPLAAFARLPGPAQGAILMCITAACWAAMAAMIRPASEQGLHPFAVLFWRNLIATALMLPWMLRSGGRRMLRTRRPWLHALRTVLILASMLTWFYAITVMPLVDAQALAFTAPLFATILAALILHEVVRLRRWSAVVIGLAGALVVLRPGFGAIDPAAFIVIANALAWAGTIITIRVLTRTESPTQVVMIMYTTLVPASLIPALFVWGWPDATTFFWVSCIAVLGLLGHLFSTKAYQVAETSVVAPFEFLQLPVIGLLGFFWFSEVPDQWTLVGAGIIIASSIYIAHRESKVDRVRASDPRPPELARVPPAVTPAVAPLDDRPAGDQAKPS